MAGDQLRPDELPTTLNPQLTAIAHFVQGGASLGIPISQIIGLIAKTNTAATKIGYTATSPLTADNVEDALNQIATILANARWENPAIVDKAAGSYTALAADDNDVWRATGAVTVNLTAAATLGATWTLWLVADGGAITVDPNGAELINGASTMVVPDGNAVVIICTGTAFRTIIGGVKDQNAVRSISTSATDNSVVRMDGTSGRQVQTSGVTINDANQISGASLVLTGTLTSVGITDNASGTRVTVGNSVLALGPNNTTNYIIGRLSNTGSMQITGGIDDTSAGAGYLSLWGGAHASRAGDFELSLQSGGNLPGVQFDASATQLSLSGGGSGSASVWVHDQSNLLIKQNATATPGQGNNTTGFAFNANSFNASAAGTNGTFICNVTTDGNTLASWRVAGTVQGFVAVSAGVVNYATFLGTHMSQLAGGAAKIEILRGSIVASRDEMCEWFAVEYTDPDGNVHQSEEAVSSGAKVGDSIDVVMDWNFYDPIEEQIEEFEYQDTVVDIDTIHIIDGTARVVREKGTRRDVVLDRMPLFHANGKPFTDDVEVPDLDDQGKPKLDRRKKPKTRIEKVQRVIDVPRKITRTIEHRIKRVEPVTCKGRVIRLRNDQLPRFEIATAKTRHRPYGVFFTWHNDGSNDGDICGLGEWVVRIAKGEVVEGGDLIEQSDVPGCGRTMKFEEGMTPIDVRKRHVATVTCAIPTPIYPSGPLYYPDGSYIVPASIHAS
jgi:hypothetical protein